MLNLIKNYTHTLLNNICFKFKIFIHKKAINKLITQSLINGKAEFIQKNFGLLLSAGTSTRFCQDVPKQLYKLNGDKPIIYYSLDLLVKKCDHVILVTNSLCAKEIENIITDYFSESKNLIHIVHNDVNCRLESIQKGIEFISNVFQINNYDNIIIHDSARPFVQNLYIDNMLNESNIYSQYCLKLFNGLMDLKNLTVVNRDNYVELCTPILSNFNLYKYIFFNFISKKNRYVYEPIDIFKYYGIEIKFFYGHYKFLRKITWFDDI